MKQSEKVVVLSLLAAALTLLFLIPLSYFWSFLLFLQGQEIGALSVENLVTILLWVLVVSAWAFGLTRMYRQIARSIKSMREPVKKAQSLKKEMDSIDIFKEVAEKEYFRRKISEETFRKIMQLCEEKAVEIKAKLKEMGVERLIEEIKSEGGDSSKGGKKKGKGKG